MSTDEFDSEDHRILLRSNPSTSAPDLENQGSGTTRKKGIGELLRQLDRGISGRRLTRRHSDPRGESTPLSPSSLNPSSHITSSSPDELGDGAPPEWALLLIGCLLGVATGVCVAAFNRGASYRMKFSPFCLVFLMDFFLVSTRCILYTNGRGLELRMKVPPGCGYRDWQILGIEFS